jgi:hypothetical protein
VHPDYPSYDLGKSPDVWVKSLVQTAKENKYDCVEFVYHVDAGPDTENHETFRCHPNYDGSKWHDWCVVRYERQNRNGQVEEYNTTAKILLWGMLTTKVTQNEKKDTPRSSFQKKDDVIPFGYTDRITTDVYVVNFDTVLEVAFVLPINQSRTMPFPLAESSDCAYFSVPPRSKWASLCWDSKLLDKYR